MSGSINRPRSMSCRSESLQMDHLGPSLYHLSYHSAHQDGILSGETLRDLETDSNSHTLAIAQQLSILRTLPKTSEPKPRIGEDEVSILEREFERNPKPTTQIKRQFAEDMGVDLARVNVSKHEQCLKVPYLTKHRIGSRTAEPSESKRRNRRLMKLGKLKRLRGNIRNHYRPTSITAMDISATATCFRFSTWSHHSACQVDLHLQSLLTVLSIPIPQLQAWSPFHKQWLQLEQRLYEATSPSKIRPWRESYQHPNSQNAILVVHI
jgi:hypothetical protein